MRDLAGIDDLYVTQEFLAQMLGVRRTSISIIAGGLQQADLIRYRRGHIKLTNIDGLKEGACECYERIRMHYERMLKPKSDS
jgi:Mn-dependent DtxR family transcriptional regulator